MLKTAGHGRWRLLLFSALLFGKSLPYGQLVPFSPWLVSSPTRGKKTAYLIISFLSSSTFFGLAFPKDAGHPAIGILLSAVVDGVFAIGIFLSAVVDGLSAIGIFLFAVVDGLSATGIFLSAIVDGLSVIGILLSAIADGHPPVCFSLLPE